MTAESSQARTGEVLPGTTEVLESCFGKLKGLEDGQSKSGFTGLVLSLGAMVTTRTAQAIGEALERCRVRDVLDWCQEKLGASVQSLRRQAYAEPNANRSGRSDVMVQGQLFTTPPPQSGRQDMIGRVTPSGQVTEFPLTGFRMSGEAFGPDGNLWFTEGVYQPISRWSGPGPRSARNTSTGSLRPGRSPRFRSPGLPVQGSNLRA